MGRKANPLVAARNSEIEAMFMAGESLGRIGEKYGISRQRVHQILKCVGIDSSVGGARKACSERKAAERREAKNRRESACIKSYGLPCSDVDELRRIGALRAFKMQTKNARMRGIEFRLTLKEWWEIWSSSGKFAERGRFKNAYVMSRIEDIGCYEVGNVVIKTLAENSREAVLQWAGKKKKLPRCVHENYPGCKTPFVVKVGRKFVGMYGSVDQAVSARDQYITAKQAA